MIWIPLWIMMTSFSILVSTKDIDSNDINAPPAPLNLDSNLRKALLKALTELENEELEKIQSENNEPPKNLPGLDKSDNDGKLFERASASAVSIFTMADQSEEDDKKEEDDFENVTSTSTTTKAPSRKPIVIIQKSAGVQHNPITTFLQSKEHREQFLASATQFRAHSNHKNDGVQTRSVSTNQINPNSVSISGNDKATTFGSKSAINIYKDPPTTPVPTPAPITEENEAKVEDVQFFSAPLVAAFTVHQDASGLPNKVEPIYKQLRNTLPPPITPTQNTLSTASSTSFTPRPFDHITRNSIENHFFLEEKQKALQQNIYNLQQQQLKQHEYLIQQQKLLQEQQDRINSQRLFADQSRIQQAQETFSTTHRNQINLNANKLTDNFKPINQFDRFKDNGNTLVSVQPSVAVTPVQQQLLQAGVLPHNGQILPVKNAIDFLSSPFNPNNHFNHFSHQDVSIAPPLQQQTFSNNFQTFPNNFVQTLPSVQTTRFFRQENGASNFGNGFNTRQTNFNQFSQPSGSGSIHPNSNRVFRSNLEGVHSSNFHYQGPIVNQQLNNLLYHSGISRGVRQSEDLGIVSKILSYNVGRDNLFARADVRN